MRAKVTAWVQLGVLVTEKASKAGCASIPTLIIKLPGYYAKDIEETVQVMVTLSGTVIEATVE